MALMTEELKKALCDHSIGNPRVLMNTAGELLLSAARQDLAQLDEKLYFQHTATAQPTKRRAVAKASS